MLTNNILPMFSRIDPMLIKSKLEERLSINRSRLKELLQQPVFTFENLMVPLEDLDDELHQLWAPFSHLNAVKESENLRAAYNSCLPMLTDYGTEYMQNEDLFKAIESIAIGPDYSTLTAVERKIIDNYLRDFRLAGVHLGLKEKEVYAELQKKLSQLTTQFAEHILDATHAWTLQVTDLLALEGLPTQTIKMAAQNAKEKQLEGWVLTLDAPCYLAVMKYLKKRDLRWLMYEAYVTRASDQGPQAGQFDNTKIMEDILQTRLALANLVGFSNYAEYSLATKMANSPEQVLGFLEDLVQKSKATAMKEIAELATFAQKIDGIEELQAWDFAYYSEKLKEEKHALSEEELRKYFPIDKVLTGVFEVFTRLYHISLKEKLDADIWHPHVQVFEIFDAKETLRGYVYIDLYARPHKRDGAWMDECRGRRRLKEGMQLPIAFLTCNFSRPLDEKPALLTHDEVLTLLHEFGHCLHHLLTKIDYLSVGGISGVPWDAVEFPSQLFEFWGYEKEALALLSADESGNPLPDELFEKLNDARNFQSAIQMLRQLEFSLFDFRIHLETQLDKPIVQKILDQVRKEISVLKPPVFNRFQHSFSHIFAGGYAAGYYSYKWAEVLSSDAFAKFKEEGIFDQATGQAFLQNILEQGGSRHPMELYIDFRGRKPSIDALLKYSGL